MNLKLLYDNPEEFPILFNNGYQIYKITNIINNQCYIGDTIENLYLRFFRSWNGGHFGCFETGVNKPLYVDMHKYGLENFTLELLPHSEELTEEYYIKYYNSYYEGYNNNLSGKGYGSTNKGFRWYSHDEYGSKTFDPLLHDKLISEGWYLGKLGGTCSDLLWVTNGKINKKIHSNKLDKFLENNIDFNLGRVIHSVKDQKWLTDGKSNRRIPESKISDFLMNNPDWKLGKIHINRKKIVMFRNDSGEVVIIENIPEIRSKFENENPEFYWIHHNSNKIEVTDGKITRKINSKDLDEFLNSNKEFKIGRIHYPTKGLKWVNNG